MTVLQFSLQDQGYAMVTTIDGYFGPETELGVRAFQADQGLTVTGIVDEATWAALAPKYGADRNGNGFTDPDEIDLSQPPGTI